MGLPEVVVVVLLFLLPGALVARAAHRRGKTWPVWGIAGVVFSWLGAIVLLLVLDRGPRPSTVPDSDRQR